MLNPKMTPDDFIAQIVNATANQVLNGVKTALRDQPVKMYDVYRQTQTGPVTQSVSLPQMLAELTDNIKVQSELTRAYIGLLHQVGQATESLRIEIEENRKLASKITKRNKRKIEEEEDED